MSSNVFYDKVIKFCPECGQELERSPISALMSCFLHGDFKIVDDKIVWDFTVNLIKR